MAIARQGNYHDLKITEYEKNYRSYAPSGSFHRYYRSEEKTMQADLIHHVEFRLHNLIMDLPPRQFDIIFCRNVMIYFDHASKVRLLQQFHDYLNEGGYLIIGFYDTLVPLIDKEKYRYANLDAKIFQKI